MPIWLKTHFYKPVKAFKQSFRWCVQISHSKSKGAGFCLSYRQRYKILFKAFNSRPVATSPSNAMLCFCTRRPNNTLMQPTSNVTLKAYQFLTLCRRYKNRYRPPFCNYLSEQSQKLFFCLLSILRRTDFISDDDNRSQTDIITTQADFCCFWQLSGRFCRSLQLIANVSQQFQNRFSIFWIRSRGWNSWKAENSFVDKIHLRTSHEQL